MPLPDSRIPFENGARFEGMALDKLRSLGYNAQPATDGADIAIGSVSIEVKGSLRHSLGKDRQKDGFNFTLMRRNGRSRRVEEDVVLLVCDDGEAGATWFVIPGDQARWVASIRIYGDPRTCGGKWAEYRSAWRLLDVIIANKREGAT